MALSRLTPNSTAWGGTEVTLDRCIVLDTFRPRVDLTNITFQVVPSNEMRIIIGRDAKAELDIQLDTDESPMQQKTLEKCDREIQLALVRLCDSVQEEEELEDYTKATVKNILYEKYLQTWKAKFDLDILSHLPPITIELKPGAKPTRVKR